MSSAGENLQNFGTNYSKRAQISWVLEILLASRQNVGKTQSLSSQDAGETEGIEWSCSSGSDKNTGRTKQDEKRERESQEEVEQ